MSDPLQQVVPGQKVAPTARTWNTFVDAARRASRTRFAGLGGGLAGGDGVAAVTVLVRNDTGGDLTAGKVLALTGVVVDPTDYPDEVRRGPVFTGDTPSVGTYDWSVSYDPFVILAEAVPDGEIGRAVLSGVAVCDVYFFTGATGISPDEGAAEAAPGALTTYLYQRTGGPARVLWRDGTGPGQFRAVVLLTGTPSASYDRAGVVTTRSLQCLGRGTKQIVGGLRLIQDEEERVDAAGADAVTDPGIGYCYAAAALALANNDPTGVQDSDVYHFALPDGNGGMLAASNAAELGLLQFSDALVIAGAVGTGYDTALAKWGGLANADFGFGVGRGSVLYAGVDGTLADGTEVVGGIITEIGAGGSSDFDGGTW